MNSEEIKKVLRPKRAIIIYESPDDHTGDLKLFNISENKLTEEIPFGMEQIVKLKNFFNKVSSESMGRDNYGFLDKKIIYVNENIFIWEAEAKKRFFKFSLLKDTLVHVPRLVFRFSNGNLKVFTVKGKKLITKETKLFKAPLMNVSDNGDVCMGNVRLKDLIEKTLVEKMKTIEYRFFNSIFTHWNTNQVIKGNIMPYIKNINKIPETLYLESPIRQIEDII